MATQDPNNASGDLPAEPREDATVAAVLSDDQAGATASGVGAGPGLNSPTDIPLPGAGATSDGMLMDDAKIRQDAVRQAASSTPAEAYSSSR